MMIQSFFTSLYLLLRPLIKWFLRRFTNLCELQRAVYGISAGSRRVKQVERSLTLSKKPQIRHLIHCLNDITSHPIDECLIEPEIVERAVNTILLVKRINPKYHPGFPKSFGRCVEAIWGYNRLITMVENLRLEQYDPENRVHEHKLMCLWNNLMPDIKLEGRITKQWQEIGFQGDDPATDFRGMGILGLENLLYFTREHTGTARHLLSHSQHPLYGYTFAVVGINITCMAWKILSSGQVKSHFYNLLQFGTQGHPTLEMFHQFYSYLFYEFDSFWMDAKPENLMQFNNIQEKFERSIRKSSDKDSCLFKMNLSVENI